MERLPVNPDNTRAPNISPKDIRRGVEELEAKIKTLQGRANATASDSRHTYHEHIAALEAKRNKLMEKLQTATETSSNSVWTDLKEGLDDIRSHMKGVFGE